MGDRRDDADPPGSPAPDGAFGEILAQDTLSEAPMPVTSWLATRADGRAIAPAAPANRAIRRATEASPGRCSAPAEWWRGWSSDHTPAAADTEGSTRTGRAQPAGLVGVGQARDGGQAARPHPARSSEAVRRHRRLRRGRGTSRPHDRDPRWPAVRNSASGSRGRVGFLRDRRPDPLGHLIAGQIAVPVGLPPWQPAPRPGARRGPVPGAAAG